MPASVETIKVIIRFKGHEGIDNKDEESWKVNGKKEILAPKTEHGAGNEGMKFTFDHVLVESTQEDMYYHAAKDTVK